MLIRDRIHGDFEITDPLALALIATPAFDRLKRVCQFGIPDRYFFKNGYSRFVHSIGVYVFLKKFGAPEKECVAGLLHDVSHTAFSHLVDWVIEGNTKKEDYQDSVHLSVLKQPDIADALRKYGLTPEEMADYHSFGLLEREIPDLCADRIDYSLRQMEENDAKRYLAKMISREGEIVFSDVATARGFAGDFLSLQVEDWAGYEACTRYEILSGVLKEALAAGDLVFDDLKTDDDQVLGKIIATDKKDYLEALKLLEKKDLSLLPKNEKPAIRKFRYVDPKILFDDKLVRLTEIDPAFKSRLEEARKINSQGIIPGRLR
jgi:uncharacterized protein